MQTLNEIREDAGMTQQDLSDVSGVSVRVIEHWEMGRRAPKDFDNRVVVIADALDVRPESIFFNINGEYRTYRPTDRFTRIA